MARTYSSFCFIVSFFCVILLCNGSARVNDGYWTYWCIAKQGLSDDLLQKIIDVYCGKPGMDCGVISPGGACFEPDTKYSHASYALDAFNALPGPASGCPVEGSIVYKDPSYGTCKYPSRTD